MHAFSRMIPASAENRAAVRTAVATLVAVLIAFKFHLDTPYWSGMTVVIVSNLYTGNIIDKAMMRILGTIAGAILGFFIAGLVVNSLLLYLFASFSVMALAVYYYHFSRYAYAWLLCALTILIIISQLAMNPANAFYVAIWRPVEIGLGVVIASLSAYSIFPNRIKDHLLTQVDTLFDDLSMVLATYHQSLQNPSLSQRSVADLNLQFKKDCRNTIDLLGALRREPGIKKEAIDQYRAVLHSIYQFTRLLQFQINTSLDFAPLMEKLNIDGLFGAIKTDIASLRQAFKSQQPFTEPLSTLEATEQFERQIKARQRELSDALQAVYAFDHFISEIRQLLETMNSLIKGTRPEKETHSIYLNAQRRLRNDPDLIKHGIKAGLTVLLALALWFISDWPGGLSGIISSIVISIRRNLYEMKNISLHRLLGCLAGGGVAVSALTLFTMNLYDFALIILVFVWIFSYFSFKYPLYAYLGLQANLALIISLAQQGGPPVYLHPPLERLAGILMGITASFIVANLVWRSDPLSMLQRYISKLSHYMKDNVYQLLLVERESVRLHDLTNLFWISRGLIESLSTESLSEHKTQQLQAFKKQFETHVFIQATISHIFANLDLHKIRTCAHAYKPSLSELERSLVRYYQGEGVQSSKQLILAMQDILKALKEKPPEDEDCFKGLIVYLDGLIQLAKRETGTQPLKPLTKKALTSQRS